jgi:uncharacterized protein (DUF1810 family)
VSDAFSLERFVRAQTGVYDRALAELQAGRKRSHWMWFVFPQIDGLGRSEMARRYALSGLDEGRAYLAHPTLGPRLSEAAQAILDSGARSARALLGTPDDLKLRSSMTLFEAAAGPDAEPFASVLDRFYAGERDPRTLDLLGG